MKRYALLDTDFISKTHSVQDDNGNHLIDRVMELPEYEFFCHAQIVTELNRYNADAPIWLSEKIGAQKIKSYTEPDHHRKIIIKGITVYESFRPEGSDLWDCLLQSMGKH